MAYPTYSSYRDSGVAWLGEVPSHWGVKRLKFMAKLQNGSDYKHIESHDGYPVIGSGGQFAYATDYLYNGESVLLGRKGTIDKPLYVNGAFWTVDTMYYTEIFQNTCPKFLYYLTLTVDFWKYSTQTALPSMTQTSLNNLIFAAPEYEEQTAIADYLDTQTAQIDALIDKQQNLLAKLAEQRSSAISQAVTRGLNPNAPMKESGVAWLGEVPSHWGVKRLKFLGEIVLGLTYSPEDISSQDNGILVLRSSNIQKNGKLVLDDNVFVSRNIPQKMITTIEDILICSRNGSRNLIGKCALIEKDGLNQTFGAFMTVYRTPYRKFIYYVLSSELFKSQLGSFLTSTINQLTTQVLGNFQVAFPPLAEQTAIADYLDKQTAHIDCLSQKVEQAIGRLKEYRTALITQAVTGKIKVITEG